MSFRRLVFVFFAGLSIIAPAGANIGWRTYSNVRFGFSICYAPTLIKGREADNGDGLVFRSPDGAKFSVWGQNNVTSQTLGSMTEEQVAGSNGTRGEVTYRVNRGTWSAISGKLGNDIFYAKVIKRGDQFIVFQATYPKSVSKIYEGVITSMSRCLKAGSPAS